MPGDTFTNTKTWVRNCNSSPNTWKICDSLALSLLIAFTTN